MIVTEKHQEIIETFRSKAVCDRCGLTIPGINYAPETWEKMPQGRHLCPECRRACFTCDYKDMRPNCGIICKLKEKKID